MLKRLCALGLWLVGSLCVLAADVVELQSQAAITGRILAEKPDQIVVDVGYTVLVVPRKDVRQIVRSGAKSPAPGEKVAVGPQPAAQTGAGFYHVLAAPPPDQTVRELAGRLGGAVVQVRTPGGLGSGFIINADGFLITNFHVIENESHITVEVYLRKAGQLEEHNYRRVRIIALNKFADLALLRIEDEGAPKFPYVPLGDSEALAVGEPVFAIGSPLGLERTVTEGIISTKTRSIQGRLYLQTTAQINPGNSGGPLFNLRGEVVGVTNMKMLLSEGLGFAVPVSDVEYFLNNRDAFAYDNDNPNNPYHYLHPPSRAQAARRVLPPAQ
jgi:serine protease Do